ncbi:MAG: hypothetical protein K9M15_02710 [Candidatus Marinimicrobia bacterium]|nr:hypothetical protein [Candidatus Neomarinimicrobiota bacterium]
MIKEKKIILHYSANYTPVYKKVKVWKKHCPKCKQILTGNGSMMLPYQCECGIWDYDTGICDYRLLKNVGIKKIAN